jgi:glycerol-3-phosphate acyltransferase PlsY
MIPSVFSEKPVLTMVAVILSYLVGSLSTGILTAKAANGPDLRTVGSKNTGASNVQRTMGWKYGLITFGGDAAKGLLACLLGRLLTGDHMGALLSGFAAVIGHNWPVFFGFKGGKGVATSCGVMCFCFPLQALVCFILAIGLIAWKRYISLGSLFLVSLYAVLVSFSYKGEWNAFVIGWAVLLALVCIARHHANIMRLIHGTENKLGSGRKNV